MTNTKIRTAIASVLAAGMLVSAGCASMNQKERGAVIGAGAGAADEGPGGPGGRN